MSSSAAEQTIRDKYLGRWLRVRVKNNRIFEGKLMCVDYKGNLILHETIATIPPEQNTPLNYELQSIYDQKLTYEPPAGLTPAEQE